MRPIVSLLVLVFGVASASLAQDSKQKSPPGRVAVVNIALALDQSEKEQRFKKHLEATLAPFTAQAKKHRDNIDAWQKAVFERDFAFHSEEEWQAKIRTTKRLLEGLDANIAKEFGKIKDDHRTASWHEIQEAIKTYATEQRLELVFGCTDPVDPRELDAFANVKRKMHAMDEGSTVPLYISARADGSRAIAEMLNRRARPKEETKPVGAERVAMVNIAYVFTKFQKAQKFKADLEATLEPYKVRARKHLENLRAWNQAIKDRDFAVDTEAQLNGKIETTTNTLKSMETEVNELVGKMQERNLVLLWKDVQGAIRTYAIQHDIDLVLGYGEPTDEDLLNTFPNINRKMQAMDLGGTVPLYAASKMDIAPEVADLLNKAKDAKKPAPQTSNDKGPAVRVAVTNIGYVFNNYERAQLFKKELESELVPFKVKAEKINKKIKQYESALTTGDFVKGEKTELEGDIARQKRDLAELEREVKNHLGAKQEANLVNLWNEVQIGIKSAAGNAGVDIVLAYGDVDEPKARAGSANVKRKMEAIDMGGVFPLFIVPRAEQGTAVVQVLNQWLRDPAKKAAPKIRLPGLN